VFHDPRNWSLDIQVMIDILRSRTRSPGAPYRSLDQEENHVKLVFCNPDLLWRSALDQPRIGQGAFIQAFQAVYKVRGILPVA
jgi:ribonucleotide monophosphatase NagD (HAD superfamily)